jgi:hypothetical protein
MTVTEKRVELHRILCDILGTENVYFQPPESIKMKYPAIVYKLSNVSNDSANNKTYRQERSYDLTVIDKDPDSEISVLVSRLPRCRYDRSFSVDNLNHFIYTIYY